MFFLDTILGLELNASTVMAPDSLPEMRGSLLPACSRCLWLWPCPSLHAESVTVMRTAKIPRYPCFNLFIASSFLLTSPVRGHRGWPGGKLSLQPRAHPGDVLRCPLVTILTSSPSSLTSTTACSIPLFWRLSM